MSVRMGFGVTLLAVASLCLIAAAAYTRYGLSNPKDYTFYQPRSTPYIVPRISTAEIVVFVLVEHLLVGAGVALIARAAS